MKTIPGYGIQQILYESGRCSIARAIRLSDQQSFIIKALLPKAMTPGEMQRYRHEFEIGQQFDSPYIIKYLELYADAQHFAILQEGGEMVSLEKAIPETGFAIADFLTIAIQMVEALSAVHQKGITHKDIKPANFVMDCKSQVVKMIDFGDASALKESQSQPLQIINKLQGTPAYISPEQTGRMNRTIDYRTDFYSLGISFYQLLCGQLPFAKKETMEFIHCHLAQQAIPLHQIKPDIPTVISDMVALLMMKNAEERYQSAYGILQDLQTCQQQFSKHKAILPFKLRQQDFSEKFQVSQKLYGRETEIATLLQTFERVSNQGAEVLLVAGYSGIGKTSLINEIQKPITLKNGYFLAGKFDQLSKSIAYTAITQAFQTLVKQLLGEPEEKRHFWREKLLAAIGGNGQLIIEVIPEVEFIIGQQPPIPSVGPIEAKNRFNNVFQKFVRVFIQKKHPLVLFLDDLQWADSASLELIKLLMTNPDIQHLLLIGAYRDNEVHELHPVILALEEIKHKQVPVQQITLTSLDIDAVQRWIADSLYTPVDEVKELAEVVYQKTRGNPFFVKMFLRSLYEQRILELSRQWCWRWDLSRIRQHAATANVMEFMISQIEQLQPSTQKVLAIASCLGHSFMLDRLELATQRDRESLQTDLRAIYNAGLAYAREESIHFIHDRVQEAAYSLAILPLHEKKLIHLLLGRQLLKKSDQPEKVFEIVDHLNLALDAIDEPDERIKLAKLNLLASQKAKMAVAYAAGLNYIQAGLACLNKETQWSSHYDLTFAIYREKAELEHSATQFEQAEITMGLLLAHAKSAIEKADVYHLLIQQKSLLTQHQESIKLGKAALKLLGMELPDAEDALAQIFEWEKNEIKASLARQDINTLLTKPDIQDPIKRATLKLLLSLLAATYLSDRPLYNVVAATSVRLSLQYGPMAGAQHGLASYGSILGQQPETAQLAYQFGQLALKLNERYHDLTQTCRLLFILSVLINPWFQSLKSCLSMTNQAFQAGLDSGELQYAGYSQFYVASLLFFCGNPLPVVWVELEKILAFVTKMKHQFTMDVLHCLLEAVSHLMGRTSMLLPASYLADLKQRNNAHALCHHAIFQAQIFYLHEDYPQAYQANLEAEALIKYIKGHYAVAVHTFYYALTLAAIYPISSESERKNYYQQLLNQQQTLKFWTENYPESFQVKYLLVSAEIARLNRQPWEAGSLYDEAIKAAQHHDLPPELALAYELAARFWLTEKRETIAYTYLNNAYLAYQRWGAKNKLAQLKRRYPDLQAVNLLAEGLTPPAASNLMMTTVNTSSLLLDMQNVIKASQMISSNIELDKLLFNMMKIIIETAGAQNGVLILNDEGRLLVQAECTTAGHISVLQALPLANWTGPHSIIEYVRNTGQLVLLGCAVEDKQFGLDPYINSNQAKSLLCMPINRQNELKGLLCIENNLANFVFTQSRVAILTILANQMAISLENARLVQIELDAANKVADEQRQRAHEAENYRKRLEEFIDTICHEIRNPLNGIYGCLGLLKEVHDSLNKLLEKHKETICWEVGAAISQQQDNLQETQAILNTCIEHQKVVVNDVLDLSKLENNKIILQVEAFSPKQVIERVLQMFKFQLNQKKLNISFDFPEEFYIESDCNRFAQVIINLLSNAIKFTMAGGISLHLSQQTMNKDKLQVRLQVKDTGIGLTPEEMHQLFQPFAQANTKIGLEYGGTGLGLVISQKLASLMGGAITVSSIKDHGTTFEFTILATPASQPIPVTKHHQPTHDISLIKPDKKILIVEDNTINQKVLANYLRGYHYHIAKDGLEGLTAYKEAKNGPFDLVFMDIEMPVMDGLEATRQIRLYEKQMNLPPTSIIGLSGNARSQQIETALQAGMDAYITKPFHKDEIFKHINMPGLAKPTSGTSQYNFFAEQSYVLNETHYLQQFLQTARVLVEARYPFTITCQNRQLNINLLPQLPERTLLFCELLLKEFERNLKSAFVPLKFRQIALTSTSLQLEMPTAEQTAFVQSVLTKANFATNGGLTPNLTSTGSIARAACVSSPRFK